MPIRKSNISKKQMEIYTKNQNKFNNEKLQKLKNKTLEMLKSSIFYKQSKHDFIEITSYTEKSIFRIFEILEAICKIIESNPNFKNKKEILNLVSEINEQLAFQDLTGQKTKRLKNNYESLLALGYNNAINPKEFIDSLDMLIKVDSKPGLIISSKIGNKALSQKEIDKIFKK